MKIKALWGFVGDKGHVRTGDVLEVSNEYGHALIGKGLAVEVRGNEGPKATKQIAPKENK